MHGIFRGGSVGGEKGDGKQLETSVVKGSNYSDKLFVTVKNKYYLKRVSTSNR